MAECNVSIDQENLPGVKEVCRDFAVLEDHCLAYNLQEQEIESHLASNVNKSRLVQKDLQVAKKLQEEEDERAKIQSQKEHSDIEQKDNEIAQEIQEELVRQAEQQRQQEEADAAIARKLQEKEEKRRQKQLESNAEEDYFEDHGATRRPLDLDNQGSAKSNSLRYYDSHASVSTRRDYSPDYSSTEAKRSRCPKLDSAAPHGRSRYPEHYSGSEGVRSKHADPYPELLLPSGNKHGDRYPECEHTETGRGKGPNWEERERLRKLEKHERDKDRVKEQQWDKDRSRDRELDRHLEGDYRRDREEESWLKGKNRERSRERGLSPDKHSARQRPRGEGRHQGRTRSRDRNLEEDFHEQGRGRDGARKNRGSWEEEQEEEEEVERERRARGRHRVHSGYEEAFDDFRSDEGRSASREFLDAHHREGPSRERTHSHPDREKGRIVHRGSGAVVAEKEYGLNEATKGMTELDLREQELKDLEVARKLQEEEMKASSVHMRAAQVAQDEEIARVLMEKEKKDYKKNREREKEKERERERFAMEKMAMERRRHEGIHRPHSDEVVRPRTRDEHEYQRQRHNHKPSRPPQPRPHDYENVHAGYGYSDYPGAPRASSRPDAAHRGAYYKR